MVGLEYEYTNSDNKVMKGKITEKIDDNKYKITDSDIPIDSSNIDHNIYPICGNDL